MTRQDTTKLLAMLQQFYPSAARQYASNEAQAAWYIALREHDYETVKRVVLEEHMPTINSPPNPGDVVWHLHKGERDTAEERQSVSLLDYARMLWYAEITGARGYNGDYKAWTDAHPQENEEMLRRRLSESRAAQVIKELNRLR